MKIHVLYIITKLELGGAQKVCLSLVKGVQNSGNSAILISGSDGILLNESKQHSNVILLKNFKREVSVKSIIGEIKNFFQLISQIKQLKKKHSNLIVHTHSTKAGILGRWAAFFARVKIRIHTIHGFAFHNHQNKIVWCIIYLSELITSFITTHFVCVSSFDIATGKKLFPRFAKKHSLIRAAVEWEKFTGAAKTNISDSTVFIFGTVACFKKQKNLIDLFKAFEIVYAQNPYCKLEIIGDGVLRPELEAWIKQHNLQERILLLGWQKNVAEFMITWDTFVLSSLWEGLPCAIIEARLLKLPVISYNTGGIKDVIIQGKNGYLIDQGNWQDLAYKMIYLIKNPDKLHDFQEFNQDLSDFNDSKMIKNHLNLYQKLTQ
ncbi:MAG: glycosyltransferase [Candidatus Babeliales bacterium]|nr:glycosyltransferase [Candidatus Babeliales bacterium]